MTTTKKKATKKVTKKKVTKKKVVRKKPLDLEAILEEVGDEELELVGSNSKTNIPYSTEFRNLAIQKITNGVSGGRMIEISGDSQCGKSFILYEVMQSFIMAGGVVILFDVENAFDPAFARRIGLQKGKNFFYSKKNIITEVFGLSRKIIKAVRKRDKNVPILMSIDSFAGLVHPTHQKNIENEKEIKGFAAMQKNGLFNFELSNFFPRYLGKLGVTFALVNHTREDHTVMFGDGTYTLGEKGIQYWCDLRIRGKVRKELKKKVATTKSYDKKKTYGVISSWKATKTRGVESHDEIELRIKYATGISKYSGLTELLVNHGFVKLGKYQPKKVSEKSGKEINDGGKRTMIIDIETGKKFKKIAEYVEFKPEVLRPRFIDEIAEDIEVDYDDLEDFVNE